MVILAYMLIFSVISYGLIIYAGWLTAKEEQYDSSYIRGTIRGATGRFFYASDLERKRDYLSRLLSKF